VKIKGKLLLEKLKDFDRAADSREVDATQWQI
jgi:hypothetical protein